MSDPDKKIFVDSDWKVEAQREKERLAEQEVASHPPELSEANLTEIVNMISMQAVIGLGGLQTPDGKQIPPDMEIARHHIDLLEVLLHKTRGNLDELEQRHLGATLHELRMAYVQLSQAMLQAAQRKSGPDNAAS